MAKYLSYLSLLGLAVTVAGVVLGANTQVWVPLPLTIISIGTLLMFLSLLGIKSEFWKQRSTQIGTNALIATLAVFVILGLINFLAFRVALKIDLTENKIFTLSPQSQEVLKNLQQPIKIIFFNTFPNSLDIQVNQTLFENYSRYSEKFDFEIVNPEFNLGLAEEFNLTSPKAIYIASEENTKLIQSANFPEQPLVLSESQLTNAIVQLQRDSTPLYLLQGHDELSLNPGQNSLSQAALRLSQIGYQVIPLNLTETLEIPSDAGAIIIPGPQRQLLDSEVQTLQTYLNQGGSVLLMLDFGTDPGLNPLLEEWGIKLDDRLVINASEALSFGSPAMAVVIEYGEHPITAELTNNPISVYPGSRAVDALEVEGIEASVLISTNVDSWAEQDLEADVLTFDPEQDRPGPLNLGIAFSRPVETDNIEAQENAEESEISEEIEEQETPPEPPAESENLLDLLDADESGETESEEKTPESRLVVFGNSTFATNPLFDPYINGDIFLNTVEWLSQDDNPLLSIRPKETNNRRINLSDRQTLLLDLTALAMMPLIALSGAVLVWFGRK